MSDTILYDVLDGVATITFNRPAVMNTLNGEMASAFAAVTEQALLDEAVRALILTGAGSTFMAGGDIHYFQANLDNMPSGVLPLVRLVNASVMNLRRMPKPVIASVAGAAAGAGLSFMLACDLVTVASDAKFTLAYNQIGMSPDAGASYFLARTVGTKKAFAMAALGERLNAEQMLQLGLITQIVEPQALADSVRQQAQYLAQGPTRAYAATKQLFNSSLENSLAQQLEAEAQSFTRLSGSEDFHSGVNAFLAKRVAEFSGR